jgi:aminoglycoside phosphotransferase (APT) family kinase protein
MTTTDPLALAPPDVLARWLDEQGLEVGQPLHVAPLSGGSSNVMFGLDRGGHRWVLRRPARVAIERANDGMRREFRILSALDGTPVPHPRAVALGDDQDVLGCTFFLMERVDGVNPMPMPPALDDDEHRAEVTFALVDALAELHRVDWREAGLTDLGRPEGFHERQVERWSRQLDSYGGRGLPGIDEVAAWLEANRPTAFEPTIMHGDYHMLNVLVAPEPPGRVLAIVDWETSTIGDPLLDLAGFCEVWCSATRRDGYPTRRAMVERYRRARGLAEVPDLTYHEVLYNFRLAILLEGIYQRSLADPTRPDADDMGERALFNVARAAELVASSG